MGAGRAGTQEEAQALEAGSRLEPSPEVGPKRRLLLGGKRKVGLVEYDDLGPLREGWVKESQLPVDPLEK